MMIDEESEEVFLCECKGYHSGSEAVHQMAIFENGEIKKNIYRLTEYGGERFTFGGDEYEGDEWWTYGDHEDSTFFQDAFESHVRQAKQVSEDTFKEILRERDVQ